MWSLYEHAGGGLEYVEQGITGRHGLPSDIVSAAEWDSLVEPLGYEEGVIPLAWDQRPDDLPALTPAYLPESAVQFDGLGAMGPAEGPQHQAAAMPDRRKQESNRLAQKKSRQKKQIRSQEAQRQLAEATAELRELRIQHNKLQCKNLLLEKTAQLSQQAQNRPQQPAGRDQLQQAHPGLLNITQQTEHGLSIMLTALGEHSKIVTLDSIEHISHAEFASIYTIYARKMGQGLLDLAGNCQDSYSINMQLRLLTSELNALTHCLAAVNPKTFQKFHNRRLDGGAGPDTSDLSEAFYVEVLAAKNLTSEQMRDLLHLRRLFYGRIGQVMRQRKQLLRQVPESGLQLTGHGTAPNMDHLAQQLQANGADEYSAYTSFASVFFRGIQTFRQHAVDIVAAYPWIPDKHRMLELLATQRGEPSMQFYLDGAGLDDVQHEANWQEIVSYLQSLNASNLHKHVPLVNNKPVQSAATWSSSAREKTVYDLLR